jgi:hypothetical protein
MHHPHLRYRHRYGMMVKRGQGGLRSTVTKDTRSRLSKARGTASMREINTQVGTVDTLGKEVARKCSVTRLYLLSYSSFLPTADDLYTFSLSSHARTQSCTYLLTLSLFILTRLSLCIIYSSRRQTTRCRPSSHPSSSSQSYATPAASRRKDPLRLDQPTPQGPRRRYNHMSAHLTPREDADLPPR